MLRKALGIQIDVSVHDVKTSEEPFCDQHYCDAAVESADQSIDCHEIV